MGQPLSAPAASGNDPRERHSWHDDWSPLRVAVLGLGATGFGYADTLVELGATVLVTARDATTERQELAQVIGAELALLDDAEMPALLAAFGPDLVLASPGFAADHPARVWAVEAGVVVWGELELAWRLGDKTGARPDWLLVSGTEADAPLGEVAELAATMLLAEGVRAAPTGGGGVPLLDAVRDPEGFETLVIAVDAAQLSVYTPDLAVGPAPLASFVLEAAEAPGDPAVLGRAYANTRVACLYSLGDLATRDLVEDAEVQEGCRAVGVGLGIPGLSELGVVEGILVDRAFLEERRTHALELGTVAALDERGRGDARSVRIALSAAALARAAGAAPIAVRTALGVD
jgi:UDP-N-acetylmuramoylalanine--D-glutamate ligase